MFYYLTKGYPFPLFETGCLGQSRFLPDMVVYYVVFNDPNAGSPTITLLRLLLPLDYPTISASPRVKSREGPFKQLHRRSRTIQSVAATGGVYKEQGQSRHGLMTRAY